MHTTQGAATTTTHTTQRGFTLVEVLAATIAGALVLGLTYAILAAGHNSSTNAQTYAHAHTSIRAATTTIRNDLQHASRTSINPNDTLTPPTSGHPGFTLTLPNTSTITYELHTTTLYRITSNSTRPVATHVRSITATADATTSTITITITGVNTPYAFEFTHHLRHP